MKKRVILENKIQDPNPQNLRPSKFYTDMIFSDKFITLL